MVERCGVHGVSRGAVGCEVECEMWWCAMGPVGYHGALFAGVSRSGVSRAVGKM